jgi:hypothetical protein
MNLTDHFNDLSIWAAPNYEIRSIQSSLQLKKYQLVHLQANTAGNTILSTETHIYLFYYQ